MKHISGYLIFTMEDDELDKRMSFVMDKLFLAPSAADKKKQILSTFEHYLDDFLKSTDSSSLKAADQEGEAL